MSDNPRSRTPGSRVVAEDLFADGGQCGDLMRSQDWASTSLGPVASWPKSLRTCVRIILTSRQPMFVWWGHELINLYNDAYRDIVGGKHPQALGQPAAEVWSEIWDQVGPRAESALQTNRGTYDEALLLIMERHGYQEETYYTFSYSPVPTDDGSIGGIICANTDETRRIIDERRLAMLRELASRTSQARTWQQACTGAAEALALETKDIPFSLIYLVDDDHRTIRLACQSGIAADHPSAVPEMPVDAAAHWKIAETLASREMQVFDISPTGGFPTGAWSRPPSRAVAVPMLPSGDTGRAGVLVVGLNPYGPLDVRYRDFLTLIAGQLSAGIANAQAYEDERKRAEALMELDRAKTVFFSNVSHEFRTPLTLMLSPVEDSLNDAEQPLPARQRERQEIIHRNALRLLKLVNSLLDFSRIEAGRMQAAYEPVELGALTEDLASTFRSALERSGIELRVDCPAVGEPVYVDRDMWEKVVLNLLSNAFKHTFAGSISVSLHRHGDQVVLSVADTGIGIAAHEIPRLFERFHRVQGAKSRTHEGTGIGLALVHELVKLHAGTVTVESELDRGSRFVVSIPLGSMHLPREQVQSPRLGAPALTTSSFLEEAQRWLPDMAPSPDLAVRDPPSGTTGRILLADDNADMRSYLHRLLSRHWSVEMAANGADALASALAQPPDLVLSDVMMPVLDGFALLRELRSHQRTQHLPVILLSARAGEDASIEGLAAGADDYLIKPFSAQELIARVRAHLQLKRQREEAAKAVRDQEALLRLVTDEARIGLIMVDREHRYLFANPTYGTFIRRDPDELTSQRMADVLGAFYDRAIKPNLDRAFAGERVDVEVRMPAGTLSDRERCFHASYTATANPVAGSCVVAVIVDITERKRTEEALRYRTEQFATLLNQAPVGVYVIDSQFRFREINPVARPAFASFGQDVIGHDLDDVIRHIRPEPYGSDLVRLFRHTLKTGEPYENPESTPYAGATKRHEWRIDRITLPDGSFGVVCYFRDITRQLEARDALARQAEDLRQANIELEHFASIASHDLQEPLRMISSYADILQQKYAALFDERAKRYFANITRAAERMRSLILALLSYSQVGRQKSTRSRVPLERVVAETLENLQEQIRTKSAQVNVRDLPTVTGDPIRLAQLFQNLITNAVKFTPEGRQPVVTIQGRDAGTSWEISVADNGIGIPASAMSHIFQIFQRLHPNDQYPGSGIGLATCKRIVEQHGGVIAVESQVDVGSTFRFTILKDAPADIKP